MVGLFLSVFLVWSGILWFRLIFRICNNVAYGDTSEFRLEIFKNSISGLLVATFVVGLVALGNHTAGSIYDQDEVSVSPSTKAWSQGLIDDNSYAFDIESANSIPSTFILNQPQGIVERIASMAIEANDRKNQDGVDSEIMIVSQTFLDEHLDVKDSDTPIENISLEQETEIEIILANKFTLNADHHLTTDSF